MAKQDQKQANKNQIASLKAFASYLASYKGMVIIACLCAIGGAVMTLLGPSKISDITNLISAGLYKPMNIDKIANIAMWLIIIYAAGFVMNWVQGYLMAHVTQRMTQQMRDQITDKINHLPLRYFDSHETGDTLSRVTNDVDTVGQAMNQSIAQLATSFALIIGCVIAMFITNWILAICGILAALLGFSVTGIVISRSQKYFQNQQQQLGVVNGRSEETFGALTIVKAFNAQKKFKADFNEQNEKLYGYAWRAQFLSSMMMPLMQFIGNLGYVVVCIVGAVLAAKNVITFGTIVAFMIYIRQFIEPLQNLAQAMSSMQQMLAASDRVFEFLGEEEMEPERKNLTKLDHAEGNIDFEHVEFGYDKNRTIIHDFNEHVKAGQKVAIVGPTGAGKTTMVNLLMRFYEVNSGDIKIDGVETKNMSRENIHDLFAMVLQDTWLFEGTLRENLVYNHEEVSDDILDRVCEDTGLTSFVEQLPNGYDSMLNDNDISAGQRQLITIARAMIKNANLLILDEATSSVDTRTELKVQQAMDKLTEGKTSFVIAHRLSTIRDADNILVMEHGDIVESGNHEELLKKGGVYADLYNSQFQHA